MITIISVFQIVSLEENMMNNYICNLKSVHYFDFVLEDG